MSAESFICTVCGYIHRDSEPPDFCPVCGAGKEDFKPHEDVVPASAQAAAQWECLNCNYIHDGAEPPEVCPVCGAEKDRFEALSTTESEAGASDFKGHLVVIGAGIAGISAVESFRQVNRDAQVTLAAKEDELPYYRLNLTRLLADEISGEDLPIHGKEWFTENRVSLRLGTEVSEINPEDKTILIRNGAPIEYDRLIIAAGAHPFIPPLPGTHRECVTSLRTFRHAENILNNLRDNVKVAVIGGGVLGLETAGALASRGASVTLIEGHDWLMPRQLNRTAGEILETHLGTLNITLLKNACTKELTGDEHIAGIVFEDGREISADMVIICTGVRSNSHLARRIGLEVNRGIVVDNHLKTSHPDILAAGDVAEHHGTVYGNWASSQFMGSIAGLNAAGAEAEFGGIPRSNTLKVLGIDLLSIGQFEPEDGSYRVLEDKTDEHYCRFVFRDTHLVGSVLLGNTSIAGPLKHAIETETDFSGQIKEGITAEALFDLLRGSI